MKHEYPLRQKRELTIKRAIERGTRMLEQGEQRSVMFSRGRMGIFLLALFVCGVFFNNKWFVMGNWVLVAWIIIFISVAHYGIFRCRIDATMLSVELFDIFN